MNNELPMISVLLAVKNEEKYIEHTLKMLFEQDYPKDKFEVIVADGCSDDKTPEIVRKFAEKHENCILLENKKILPCKDSNFIIEGHSMGMLSGGTNSSGNII